MEDWLKRFTSGSAEGWDEFLERFSRLIYKVFCTRSFYFSREEIEELFQEFMLGLMKNDYRKILLFEGRNSCSFASYLKKIALNQAIDMRKKLNRQRMVSLQVSIDRNKDAGGAELVYTLDSGQTAPEQDLVTQEESKFYKEVLYRLNPAKLLIVILIVYHKYNREDLAELMKTSRQNIDVIFNRCKTKLQGLLKSVMSEEGEITASVWNKRILSLKDKILLGERDRILDVAVKSLSSPEDLVTSVAFINYLSMAPTPERMARIYNLKPKQVQSTVEQALKKIAPGKAPKLAPKSESLV